MAQDIATLASVKQALGAPATTTDDDVLNFHIDGVNAAIIARLGYYTGPSSATTLTYDGRDAVRDGRRLWVTPGIRALTSIEIASVAVDVADIRLGPPSYRLRPNEPFHWIERETGCFTGDIVTVGMYGWAMVPADLARMATAWATRSWKTRATGDADVIGSDEFGEQIISDRLPAEWRRTIELYELITKAAQ